MKTCGARWDTGDHRLDSYDCLLAAGHPLPHRWTFEWNDDDPRHVPTPEQREAS